MRGDDSVYIVSRSGDNEVVSFEVNNNRASAIGGTGCREGKSGGFGDISGKKSD
jgi:hypothetical protein